MIAIANNLTTRNRKVAEALRPRTAESISTKAAERYTKERTDFLRGLATQCARAGADIIEINLQQRYDEPEIMKFAVETVQKATDRQLCLSSRNSNTLKAGLRVCWRPPVVNYVSLSQERLEETLPIAARYGAEIILLVADPTAPGSIDDILKSAAVLVGAANESGIPNNSIYLDPGVLHVTTDLGQRYSRMLFELLPAIAETFDPPIKTTCWINNISAGAPRRLRPIINNTFLAMLGGAGLSSAFVDVLNKETMRTIRLIRMLKDEIMYSDRELER
jgi:5-methyltetrahydrofolate corrinoid/iron sulfur protein methyltransferase